MVEWRGGPVVRPRGKFIAHYSVFVSVFTLVCADDGAAIQILSVRVLMVLGSPPGSRPDRFDYPHRCATSCQSATADLCGSGAFRRPAPCLHSRWSWVRRASPSLFSLSSLRNFVRVVESGTGSPPKSIPTKLRRLALSCRASSHDRSARLNQCWMKRMRSMRAKPMGGRPLPALG